MSTANASTERIVDDLKQGYLPYESVVDLTRHPGALVRANAIEALVRFFGERATACDELVEAIRAPSNSVRLMGTISVAHLAVAGLCKIDTPSSLEKATAAIANWSSPDRDDLLWYLRSEGLLALHPELCDAGLAVG